MGLEPGEVTVHHLTNLVEDQTALDVRLRGIFSGDPRPQLNLELEAKEQVQLLTKNLKHLIDHCSLNEPARFAGVSCSLALDLLPQKLRFQGCQLRGSTIAA